MEPLKITILFALFYMLGLGASHGQAEETEPPLHIQTVIFAGQNAETGTAGAPIAKLGERLLLRFDDLNADERDYFYVIEHYNFNWTPTDLVKSEYLSGFDDVRIQQYVNSYNTLQMFSHYVLTIPNRDTRGITKSGNYMLKIKDDRGQIVFSRKFMVYENESNVRVSIHRSRDLKYIRSRQVVNFTVQREAPFINPNQNVKTLLIQNRNLKTAIGDLKPQYTMGSELVYRYDQEAAFQAGNEYLFFDNSDVRGATVNIRRVELNELYENFLFTDITRKDRQYVYNPDINGGFSVRNQRAENHHREAEYTWVHFTLRFEEDLGDRDVHIYGGFNNFGIDEHTQMDYDRQSGVYYKPMLFKQGFYNYKYVVVGPDGQIDEGMVDGHFEVTENDYDVLVYYRRPGGRFDRIVGVGSANSENITNN